MAVLREAQLSAAFLSDSPDATAALGAALGERVGAGDVVALEGGLGAGKTVFVKGLAAGLGIDPDTVTSPTFTLVHEYRDTRGKPRLFHVDLYRIERPEALEGFAWDEAMGRQGVAVVEWADQAGAWLPAERLDIHLAVVGQSARRIVVAARGERPRSHLEALLESSPWRSRRVPA